MSLVSQAEELLAQARLHEKHVSSGKSIPGEWEEDEAYVASRQAIIDAAEAIKMKVMTPDMLLFTYMSRVYDLAVLNAFLQYDIANSVPDEGKSFEDLAKELGLPQRGLEKIVRKAMAHGIYQEPSPGLVQHTEVSAMFRLPGIRSLCRFTVEVVLPSMMKLLEALEKWQGSQDPKHTAFNLAFGQVGLMDRFPDEACFKAIMSAADAKGLSSYGLWQELDKPGSVFVDVGGNHGYGSLAIAKTTKHMQFVVEDMASVIAKAEAQEREPGGVLVDGEAGHRISLRPYDIFSGPQPVADGDVYFFRAIFHNWSDEMCLQILRNLLPALKRGAHVVICDIVMRERSDVTYEQQYTRTSDLSMYALHNGWERTQAAWQDIFSAVDPAFHILDWQILWPGSYQRFIHAVWN
ncbi:sterigmatocystin 8-O-methyltransferase [Lecanosticta acicola]|uniref:Sterigmatocystin 8-O-methyltransferase n=1 Tax=Lecanosticta acicola TaxID=111012 RepID=A0AAI8Z9E5_9PEZI|nr:sterigmatocystin 8-O-methyltransferase [Lecanosticta acicola]